MNKRNIFKDEYGVTRIGWVLVTVFGGIAALIVAGIVIAMPIAAGYGKNYCNQYHTQWNRPTKFIRYSYWSWDCLTKVGDNQWLPTSKVRVVVK